MNLDQCIKLKKLMTTFEKQCFDTSLNRLMNDGPYHRADRAFGITKCEARETYERIVNEVVGRNPNWEKEIENVM